MKAPYSPGDPVSVMMKDGSASAARGTIQSCTMAGRPFGRPEWEIRVKVWSDRDQEHKYWDYKVNSFGTSDFVGRC